MKTHKEIFQLAWPYTLAMASGFIVQAVDSTMVAPIGTNALAALSVAVAAVFIPNSLTMGLITSVQKGVAKTSDVDEKRRALSSGLLLATLVALPLSLIYAFYADIIAQAFTSGPSAILAAQYMRIFCFAFIFASMNQAFSGYWIGMLKSRIRLAVTLAVTATAIGLNIVLTPKFGLSGVAIAAASATAVGFFVNLTLALLTTGFRLRRPERERLKTDGSMVFGISLHQLSLALTLNAGVFIVGHISVRALAIANVIGVLTLPAIYLGIGYGTAAGSFLAQALRDNSKWAARAISRKALSQVFGMSCIVALLLVLFSSEIRGWFFKDPDTFAMAKIPMLLLAVLYLVDGLCCALQRFHFVADGIRKSFLIMTGVQWGAFIPLAWIAVHYFGMSYSDYLILHIIQRLVITIILAYCLSFANTTHPA